MCFFGGLRRFPRVRAEAGLAPIGAGGVRHDIMADVQRWPQRGQVLPDGCQPDEVSFRIVLSV